MKLVVMVLLGFEVLMILTKKSSIANRCICADIFSSSPVVVHATCGRFDFFTLGLMTAFIIISTIMIKWLRTLMMLLVVIFGIGFILVIYPAHRDAGVLADFYFVGLLIYYSKKVSWDLLDVVLIGGQFYLLAESWFISG